MGTITRILAYLKYASILSQKPDAIDRIDLQRIDGDWVSGFALDFHTTKAIDSEPKRTQIADALYWYKYRKQRRFLSVVARTAAEFVSTINSLWKIDLIIPVPSSDTKRGFSPPKEISELVAYLCELPYSTRALKKIKQTQVLKEIEEYSEREEILKGAFKANPKLIQGKRILLIDDLYRSGATLTAVANEIASAGAAVIFVLTITKTRYNR